MKRKEHWEYALATFLTDNEHRPFEWGANDCALFTAAAIQSMTGVDPAAKLRGAYSNASEALKACVMLGAKTFEEMFAQLATEGGYKEISPMLAQRGDAVVCDAAEGVALGIVNLNGTHAVFVSPKGLNLLPVLDCRRAWRIG